MLNICEEIRKRGEKVQSLEVAVKLSGAQKHAIWNELSKGSNFLKHADRKPEDVLNLETLNNELLIKLAIAAHQLLSVPPTSEMFVFYIYYQASNWESELATQLTSDELLIVEALVPMTASERRLACQTLLGRSGSA